MNDLPKTGTIIGSQQPQPLPITGSSGLGKEGEIVPSSELPVQEIQKELELPREVIAAGVKKQPTVVTLPKPITQMGVKPTGSNVGLGTGATVVLPLTQPQIAQGLQKSILDSWRWLAVWCIRKLKQFRLFNLTKPPSTNNESVRINE